jgi:hypothetical protein
MKVTDNNHFICPMNCEGEKGYDKLGDARFAICI